MVKDDGMPGWGKRRNIKQNVVSLVLTWLEFTIIKMFLMILTKNISLIIKAKVTPLQKQKFMILNSKQCIRSKQLLQNLLKALSAIRKIFKSL